MERFPSRYQNLELARSRFGDRVDRLGRHLMNGDERADRVIDAIDELEPGAGWRLFKKGLAGGSRAIKDAPLALRELLEEAEHVPAWVDWETCDRGGEVLLRAGPLGGAVLGARSLVLGYASPGGNKPLVFSGRLKEQAGPRLNETARFVQAVCRPGGMRPHAEGWRITLKVRLIHAQVRKMISRSGRWRSDAWGLPINQHDMAGTTLLFSVSILDGLRKLGVHVSPASAESYVHLWRWVGRTIGVDADVLPASEPEGMRLGALIEATMGEPDEDSIDLTRALFESPYAKCVTEKDRREAARHVAFGHLVCRALIGDDLADKLRVPRTSMRYALPMMKRFVAGVTHLTQAVPFAERSAILAGSRYWDRVVEIGLPDATYEFPLPRRLGAAAA